MTHIQRNFFNGIACLTLLIFLPMNTVSAHDVSQDGNISAVMHIDPGDSPIVGEEAGIHFDFSLSKEKIDLKKCDCSFNLSSNNRIILSASTTDNTLFDVATNGLGFVYRFPAKATYDITITGKSLTGRQFSLNYDVDVTRGTSTESPAPEPDHTEHSFAHDRDVIIIFGGGFLVGLALTFLKPKRSK
jgi:hypothetical protein